MSKKKIKAKDKTRNDDLDYCQACGTYTAKHDLYYGPDPFQSEIYNEFENTVLCSSCYRESCDSI